MTDRPEPQPITWDPSVARCTHPHEGLRTWVLEGTPAAAIVYCTRCYEVLVVDMREALLRREAERDAERTV